MPNDRRLPGTLAELRQVLTTGTPHPGGWSLDLDRVDLDLSRWVSRGDCLREARFGRAGLAKAMGRSAAFNAPSSGALNSLAGSFKPLIAARPPPSTRLLVARGAGGGRPLAPDPIRGGGVPLRPRPTNRPGRCVVGGGIGAAPTFGRWSCGTVSPRLPSWRGTTERGATS